MNNDKIIEYIGWDKKTGVVANLTKTISLLADEYEIALKYSKTLNKFFIHVCSTSNHKIDGRIVFVSYESSIKMYEKINDALSLYSTVNDLYLNNIDMYNLGSMLSKERDARKKYRELYMNISKKATPKKNDNKKDDDSEELDDDEIY